MQQGCVTNRVEDIPKDLAPGAHVIVLSSDPNTGIALRRLGLEARDTILVLSSQGPRLAFLSRKPCAESTIAENVLRHGTGALNINACRVRHANEADLAGHKAMVDSIKSRGGQMGNSWKNSSDLAGASDVSLAGRWPSNLVLLHDKECRCVGSRKEKAPVINRFKDGMKPFGEGAGHPYESVGGGVESVPTWSCSDTCPVKALDEQSGNRLAGGSVSSDAPSAWTSNVYGTPTTRKNFQSHKDSGGASRFFPQFKDDSELIDWLKTLIGRDAIFVSM